MPTPLKMLHPPPHHSLLVHVWLGVVSTHMQGRAWEPGYGYSTCKYTYIHIYMYLSLGGIHMAVHYNPHLR